MKTMSIFKEKNRSGELCVRENFTPTEWETNYYEIHNYEVVNPSSFDEVKELVKKHENCRFVIEREWVCDRTGFHHRALMPYVHIHFDEEGVKVGSNYFHANEHQIFDRVEDMERFFLLIPIDEKPIERQEMPEVMVYEEYQLDLFGGWV